MLPMDATYLLYYVPLLITISLVYGATRHEDMRKILAQAWHTAYWITGFMGIIFVILLVLVWML